MLYGCELWGYSNIDVLERLHLRFCKILLKVKKSTPNAMVYGELGRHPKAECYAGPYAFGSSSYRKIGRTNIVV